jgi:hypothetical protein
MASIDLWVEGGWGAESMVWSQEVALDVDRLHYDQHYADMVDRHIRDTLDYLAKEIETIGVYTPREL